MIELGAAARPSCVIGASVWVSTLDKSACPNWVVPIDATIDFEKKMNITQTCNLERLAAWSAKMPLSQHFQVCKAECV